MRICRSLETQWHGLCTTGEPAASLSQAAGSGKRRVTDPDRDAVFSLPVYRLFSIESETRLLRIVASGCLLRPVGGL